MKGINEHIDIQEAKEIFSGDNNNKKYSYADMIGRTMVRLEEKYYKNLEETMDLMIEFVTTERDDEVKEAMFDSMRDMAGLNHKVDLSNSIDKLVSKLELLNDRDLVESILVISNTFNLKYLDLMKKYSTHPDDYVRESSEETLSDWDFLINK